MKCFSQSLAVENIKSEVIHGHVVPGRILFTMPSNPSKTEKTATYEAAGGDNEKDFPLVVVAIQPQGSNGWYLASTINLWLILFHEYRYVIKVNE